MLLVLDVGNTSTALGLFQHSKLLFRDRIVTHPVKPVRNYHGELRRLLKHWKILGHALEGVVLSSVVPKATVSLKQALKTLGAPRPFILGENIQAPVINRYRIPAQVGQDRLVNAAAAHCLYGGPAIVVDFGTAITVDLVSKRREYLGGLIVPGVEISLEALTSRAALLPRIELKAPTELLGRDTASSMKSGIFYGFGALCDGLVSRVRSRYAPRSQVIATGGYARLIAPYCRTLRIVNPHLTLQGLELTYRKGVLA